MKTIAEIKERIRQLSLLLDNPKINDWELVEITIQLKTLNWVLNKK
jgi:hypothetical protein